MNKSFFTSLLFIIFCLNLTNGAIIKKSLPDSSTVETIAILTKMQASLKSKTDDGLSYTMYAIKAKQNWIFLILDSLSIYSMKFDDSSNQLTEVDKNFADVIYLSVKSNSLEKKQKIYLIAGTEIECYYVMQRKIFKLYSSLKKLNRKSKNILSKAKKGKTIAQIFTRKKFSFMP